MAETRSLRRGRRPELMWGLGLTELQRQQIETAIGPGFFLRNFPSGRFPWKKELGQAEKPTATWIPWRIWNDIPEYRRNEYRTLANTQRILIQENEDDLSLEKVLEEGFLTVIRAPLSRNKVQDAVFRAKEVTSMYSDIYRMTEEILLERELLARKTDQLMFLNKILASANESLEPATILMNAKETLELILPVRQLHAAFWQRRDEDDSVDVELYLNGKAAPDVESRWVEQLMAQAATLGGGPVNEFQIGHVDPARRPEFNHGPEDGRLVVMPLTAGQESFGCLALLCEPGYRLGKDEVETFRSAVNHLGLALRNAMLFKEVKLRADHDGLTRIYNRHTFDERLVYELRRRQRYHHDLSLLMVDLDHFKNVNDTYGHQAGDAVLRKVGEILTESLRSTDLAARYGGEEFVVLLPHTSEEDAWKLAERIRARVAEARFESEGREFSVTSSIGVASVEAGSLSRDEDLVIKADKALYQAKHNGRNMTVVSGRHPELASVPQ